METDRDKLRLLNEFLCKQASFDAAVYADLDVLVSTAEPVPANCASLSAALNYLCAKLEIPCIMIHGENHFWNAVYCDGSWSYIDVSLNAQVKDHAYLLFADSTKKQSRDPEAVRFLKELLVPGST